jgi:hypothetical protein
MCEFSMLIRQSHAFCKPLNFLLMINIISYYFNGKCTFIFVNINKNMLEEDFRIEVFLRRVRSETTLYKIAHTDSASYCYFLALIFICIPL